MMKQTSQFGTIISSRNVHPYQTTVVPRSKQQFATASRIRAKYPWAEDVNTAVDQTTDRSTPEHYYHVRPQNLILKLLYFFNDMKFKANLKY